MTSDNPYVPSSSGQPDDPPTEYLGEPAQRPPGGRRRRTLLLTAAAVGVVGVVGAGAWGVGQLLGGGPEPATAVPADAVAYLAVDLDPSAAQKIEAFRTLRKFPALKDKLDIGSRDDVREWVFEQIQADRGCADLTFDDVDSWLGYRVGVAALPTGKDEPDPVVVLQVDDQDAARDGIDELLACGGDNEDVGRAFVGDYLVLAETQEVADQAAQDATSEPLADDADFQRWMDEAGDPGIITGYLSADAPALIADTMRSASGSATALPPPSEALLNDQGVAAGTVAPSPDADDLEKALADFEGAAGVVRFDAGAVEAEVVAQGLPGQDATTSGDSGVQQLPDSTILAFGLSLGDGWADQLLEQLRASVGDDSDVDQMLADVEEQTGLDLPEDAERLLGDGFSVAVDADIDLGAFSGGMPDPSDLPVGVRITGDPDPIVEVLDKLTASLGPEAGETLVVEQGDGAVAVGLDPDYVKRLAGDGSLGDSDAFTAVIPEAGDASGALFADFDEGDWVHRLADQVDDADADDVVDNLEPLSAVGLSGWTTGDVAHALLTVTTD